jgi:hypothetical protein
MQKPYATSEDNDERSPTPEEQSGWAFASWAFLLIACLVEYQLVIEVTATDVSREARGLAWLIYFLYVGFFNFIGAILALIGLAQRQRKRALAGWALALNVAFPVINMIVGFAIG